MRGFALHCSGSELRARERGSEAQSNRGKEGEGAVFATNGESGAGRPLKRREGETVVVVQWFRMVGWGRQGDQHSPWSPGQSGRRRQSSAWHWHARFPAMSFNTMATITDGLMSDLLKDH